MLEVILIYEFLIDFECVDCGEESRSASFKHFLRKKNV